jgi:hypothetical protein
MDVNLTVIQLALIFFPGIIWAAIHLKYCAIEKPSDARFIVHCFVFGVLTYVVTFPAYSFFEAAHPIERFFRDPTKIPDKIFGLKDFFITASVALALGVGWTYFLNHKVAGLFLQKIGATKRYGDEDVWAFVFNSAKPYVEYVHVRDFEKKIIYSGWVQAFSDSGKSRELLLRDVQIFDFDGNLMYDMPNIYLSREP